MMKEQTMANFAATGIYALTAEELSAGRSNIEVVGAMLEAGIKFIQYREKNKKAGVMYEECKQLMKMTRAAGASLIIDDFVDLMLAVDADGIHIGQEDLPPEVVRRLVGEDKVIGLSTHEIAQARAAKAGGIADYIGVGPVFTTHTKVDVMDAVGIDYVKAVVKEQLGLPFVAIGGIKEHNIAQVRAAGAETIAVVSEIVGAADIVGKIKALKGIQ